MVVGEYHQETIAVFEEIAKAKNAKLYKAFQSKETLMPSDLKGDYQKSNIRTVQTVVKLLQKRNFNLGIQHLAKGLQNVVKNTGLQGRWQTLQESPKIICDTAHNKEGLAYVLKQLQREPFEKLHIVLGFVSDKAVEKVLPLFPKTARYYFCKPNILRGMETTELLRQAENFGLQGTSFSSVQRALQAAKKCAQPTDLIFVGGSTFVVAEVV